MNSLFVWNLLLPAAKGSLECGSSPDRVLLKKLRAPPLAKKQDTLLKMYDSTVERSAGMTG